MTGAFNVKKYTGDGNDQSIRIKKNSENDSVTLKAKCVFHIYDDAHFWIVCDGDYKTVFQRTNDADYLAYPLFKISDGILVIQGKSKTNPVVIDGANRAASGSLIRSEGGITVLQYASLYRGTNSGGGGAISMTGGSLG